MPSGRKGRRVWAYGPDGAYRGQYDSVTECSKALGISRSSLDKAIRDGEVNRKTGMCFDYEVDVKEESV